MSANTLWARINPQLKKAAQIAAINADITLSEWVIGAMMARLNNPTHEIFSAVSVPDMGYNDNNLGTELTELLQDGDTQPSAGERE